MDLSKVKPIKILNFLKFCFKPPSTASSSAQKYVPYEALRVILIKTCLYKQRTKFANIGIAQKWRDLHFNQSFWLTTTRGFFKRGLITRSTCVKIGSKSGKKSSKPQNDIICLVLLSPYSEFHIFYGLTTNLIVTMAMAFSPFNCA